MILMPWARSGHLQTHGTKGVPWLLAPQEDRLQGKCARFPLGRFWAINFFTRSCPRFFRAMNSFHEHESPPIKAVPRLIIHAIFRISENGGATIDKGSSK